MSIPAWFAGDFDESKHPRGAHGRWGEAGAGGSATPREVGAALRRGGHKASSSSGTRIRGAPIINEGYKAVAHKEPVYRDNNEGAGIIGERKTGLVEVTHEQPISATYIEKHDVSGIEQQKLNEYRDHLKSEGYHVSREPRRLIVGGKGMANASVFAGNAGNPAALIRWFEDGADGQINYGEPGQFDQCVSVASEHMDDDQAKGFCAERIHNVTGEWPGKKAHAAADTVTASGALSRRLFAYRYKAILDSRPDIEAELTHHLANVYRRQGHIVQTRLHAIRRNLVSDVPLTASAELARFLVHPANPKVVNPIPQIDAGELFMGDFDETMSDEMDDPTSEIAAAIGAGLVGATVFGTARTLNRAARAHVDLVMKRLAQSGRTSMADIQAVLADSYQDGEDYDSMSSSVGGLFERLANSKAGLLAAAAATGLIAGMSTVAARLTDLPAERMWVTMEDDRVRGSNPKDQYDHVDAHGQIVGIDEPFSVSDEDLDYPGDPKGSIGNTANCRCWIVMVNPQTGDDQQPDLGEGDLGDAEFSATVTGFDGEVITDTFDFDESKHPREHGKFVEVGGGGDTVVSIKGRGSVDDLLAANPRKEGEAIFEYQSRLVAKLDPEAKHEMLFALRERCAPVGYLVQGASEYRHEHGLPDPKVDIGEIPAPLAKAEVVAEHFDEAKNDPNDPEVKAAYDDFKQQNAQMWDFLTRPESAGGMGVKVDFSPLEKGDPYPSATAQAEDLRDNHHLTIQSGLGGNNPLLTTQEYDQFRAVHDAFGHSVVGNGFDRHGEYQAWLQHMTMYTPPGSKAMSSEYHGVNCVAPDTLVLTADLRWVRAGDLHVDDELIGFEEELSGRGRGGSSHLCRSIVEITGRKMLPSYRVVTDRGELTVSEGHGFVAIGGSHERVWREAKDVRSGHRLVWTTAPWSTLVTRESGYLAGLLDGEGWVNGTRVHIAQNPGLVLDEAIAMLKYHGCEVTTRPNGRKAKQTPGRDEPYENANVAVTVQGGRWEAMRLLGRVRPVRLLANSARLWEGGDLAKRGPAVKQGNSWATVLEVEFVGLRECVTLQTSSRTFIAEGFPSHNTALWASPPDMKREGTGRAVLLPDSLIGNPWDKNGNLVRVAAQRATFAAAVDGDALGYLAKKLGIKAGSPFASDFDHLPWHYDEDGGIAKAADKAEGKMAVQYAPIAQTLSQRLLWGTSFDFDPDKHPRDAHGRFDGPGGGAEAPEKPHPIRDALLKGLADVAGLAVPESRTASTAQRPPAKDTRGPKSQEPKPPGESRHHGLLHSLLNGIAGYGGMVDRAMSAPPLENPDDQREPEGVRPFGAWPGFVGSNESLTYAEARRLTFDFDEEKHPRGEKGSPEGGKFIKAGEGGDSSDGGSRGSGTKDDPVRCSDPTEAARLLGEGKYVELKQARQVSTMLDKIKMYVDEAKAKGGQVPDYNLCHASVEGTNLFCAETQNIPRIMMPQLSGKPEPGSWADKNLTKNSRGEVDLGPAFIDELKSRGIDVSPATVPANVLRASQNELVGDKVAGIADAIDNGTYTPLSIFATKDDYVVDGHHRWAGEIAAGLEKGQAMKMDIQQIDAPILKVLAIANNFAASRGIPPAAGSIPKALKAALDALAV